MWRCGQVPRDFKDAIIVQFYKRKDNSVTITEASHYLTSLDKSSPASSTIASTDSPRKGFCRKVNVAFNDTGAPPTWSYPHQLQEKCQEMRTHSYTTLVDLMRAGGELPAITY
ncbi:hypothetical protein SprV_0100280800 [Sparganum proliferum]